MQPLSRVASIRSITALTLFGLATSACGGGGAGASNPSSGIDPSSGCQSGTWYIEATDESVGGGCVDLGIDGAVIELKLVDPSLTGVETAIYAVQSDDFVVEQWPAFSLAVAFDEIDATFFGLSDNEPVAWLYGSYYVPSADITVDLDGFPELGVEPIEASCESFQTWLNYEVYPGDWVFAGQPTVAALCSGRVRINGSKGAFPAKSTSSDVPLVASLALDGSPTAVLLTGSGAETLERGFLMSAGPSPLQLELSPGRHGVEVTSVAAGEASTALSGTLAREGGQLSGKVTIRPSADSIVSGQLSISAARSPGRRP
ncbi:hypothetical protein [Engelhardtia mirabilis]|uniref:Uncharacterized protein n=1 Tax=Engelhardtia mirabilis TaxID=2528011 RepID=A0A518BFK0_9BACT|nr:hypothetical protein Pla133_08110 [Planctomycetes bacterium Pla133]QDV00071.1 hypothetical protein Pla86_08100 [Planctomycetes bacterium Pla86]